MTQIIDLQKSDGKEEFNLDRVLVEEVGQCGRFQIRVLSLCFFLSLLGGTQASFYLFTFNRVKTRCVVPECESISSASNFTPSWIHDAIPPTRDSFDSCRRYATVSANSSTCSADVFDRNSTVECEEYVYEHTNSAIYEYKLACDHWRPNLVGSLIAAGNIVALLIGGYVGDRWGRRVALTLSAFNGSWIGMTLYFASTYESYVVIGFIHSVVAGSYYSNSYVLATEYVGPKHRAVVSGIMSSLAAVGRVVTAVIMFADPYWRNLIVIIYCPLLVTITFFWIAPESIRWLLIKNRHEEAISTLKKAAAINGNLLSEKTLQKGFKSLGNAGTTQNNQSEPWLFWLIFREKTIFLRCIITPVWWFTTVLVFHGLSIASTTISEHQFLNYGFVCAVAIPGYWLAVVLSEKTGRKPLLMAAFWICGASQLVYILIPKGNYWLTLSVYLIGKLSISMCNTLNYLFTAELYPTRYRASLLAFSSTVGRVGTVLAPLGPAFSAEVWEYLPFAVYGSLAFFASFLVPLVPETVGTTLPDTMEDAVNLGKGQPRSFSVLRVLRRLVIRNKQYTVQRHVEKYA